jgi:5-methylthioribose kinase
MTCLHACRAAVARYSNPEMCALTEKVIFTEPYTVAANNRHNSPHLDADVAELQVW